MNELRQIWKPTIQEINKFLQDNEIPRIDIISIQQYNRSVNFHDIGFNLFYVHRNKV